MQANDASIYGRKRLIKKNISQFHYQIIVQINVKKILKFHPIVSPRAPSRA